MFKDQQNIINNLVNGIVVRYKGKELLKPYYVPDGNLKFLVVGTGRCGSVFMAKLLTSIGIPCGHECIFSFDGIKAAKARLSGDIPVEMSLISKLGHYKEEMDGKKWLGDSTEVLADSSYMAAPYLGSKILNDTKIIHIIRDPIKVINSFVHGFKYFDHKQMHRPTYKEYHRFIFHFIPELENEDLDPISRCALYWVRWNEMIIEKCKDKQYILHKVEDKLSDDFANFVGKELPEEMYSNKRSNHKNGLREKFTKYDQVPDKEVRAILIRHARKYRYIKPIF